MNKEMVAGDTKVRVSAIIICDKRILLIHRRKNGEVYWSLPGGRLEAGETEYEAVYREVEEETGMEITDGTLLTREPRDNGDVDVVYLCEIRNNCEKLVLSGPEAQRNGKDNHYRPEWVCLKDVKKLPVHPKNGWIELENILKKRHAI